MCIRDRSYPYVGNAMPRRIQRRDAEFIKELGANTVRTSHYPRGRHFLDRGDELGLLVFEEIPGWQHTVSYTHLDVYKRQPTITSPSLGNRNDGVRSLSFINRSVLPFHTSGVFARRCGSVQARTIPPVSYTHLSTAAAS